MDSKKINVALFVISLLCLIISTYMWKEIMMATSATMVFFYVVCYIRRSDMDLLKPRLCLVQIVLMAIGMLSLWNEIDTIASIQVDGFLVGPCMGLCGIIAIEAIILLSDVRLDRLMYSLMGLFSCMLPCIFMGAAIYYPRILQYDTVLTIPEMEAAESMLLNYYINGMFYFTVGFSVLSLIVVNHILVKKKVRLITCDNVKEW